MATEKTWQFDMNRSYTPNASNSTLADDLCKYILWYYKAFLTGQIGGATLGLWTVFGSSDGVTAGLDGVDRWTSTYTNGKLTHVAAGSAHSWVILQSPVIASKTYYLLLDYNVTGSGYQCAVGVSLSAPTGGTVTTAPTMSTTVTAQNFGLNIGWGVIRLHGMLTTEGSFIILASRNNTSQFFSGFLGVALSNTKEYDQAPFFLSMAADTTPMATTGFGAIGSWDSSISVVMRPADNVGNGGAYGVVLPTTTTFLPVQADIFDGTFWDYPLWVSCSTNGYRSIRGRLPDIFFHNGSTPCVGTVDDSVSPNFMSVGKFWFPCNTLPIL